MLIPAKRPIGDATDIPPAEVEKKDPDKIGKYLNFLVSTKPRIPLNTVHDRLQPKKDLSE